MHRQLAVVAMVLGLAAGSVAAQDVGQFAVDPEIKSWVNLPKDFAWSQLKGRVVLIERWSIG